MREITWHITAHYDGIFRIEQPFTEIGHITIEHGDEDGNYLGYIFIQLGNYRNGRGSEIPFALYDNDDVPVNFLEFEDGAIYRNPNTEDFMEVFHNMTENELTELVAKLFGIDIQVKHYPWHKKSYRIA